MNHDDFTAKLLGPVRFGPPARPARAARLLPLVPLALAAAGCGDDAPDAYGNFEADEVTVSAEVDGRLLRFDVRDGDRLEEDAVVGLVDTIPAALQLRELRARLGAAGSSTEQAGAEARAIGAELETARTDLARTERLYEDDAATRKQLDDARTRVEVLSSRLAAARSGSRGSGEQAEAVAAEVARLEDRLARSRITNPAAGTVLASYVEAGEFVRAGQPLYDVARLDTLTLHAFVDGGQLSDLRIGQAVTVHYDAGADSRASTRGVVSRIASEAEFTPTPIQTREERTDLVYEIEIRVANPDGRLKIGMPADVALAASEGAEEASADTAEDSHGS